MKKIFWSRQEWSQLESVAVELLVDKPFLNDRELMASAQACLPEERRRKMSPSVTYTNKARLDAWRQKGAEARKLRSQAAEEPKLPVGKPDAFGMHSSLLELLELFADKLAEKLAQRISVQVNTQTRTTTRHDPTPKSPAAPSRPTVLIVGLLGSQCHQIRNSFAHLLDITCISAEEAKSRGAAQHKDNTILMTKFISHAATQKYREHPNLKLCNGGMSQLAEALWSIVRSDNPADEAQTYIPEKQPRGHGDRSRKFAEGDARSAAATVPDATRRALRGGDGRDEPRDWRFARWRRCSPRVWARFFGGSQVARGGVGLPADAER